MYEYINKMMTELPWDMNAVAKTPDAGHFSMQTQMRRNWQRSKCNVPSYSSQVITSVQADKTRDTNCSYIFMFNRGRTSGYWQFKGTSTVDKALPSSTRL